jgi:nucleotide-binding universal stress UspA family protein
MHWPKERLRMIKSILVPATGSSADATVFSSALAVAHACAAHLDFLHIRIDAVSIAASIATDGRGAMIGAGNLIEALEKEADAREQGARRSFESFCRGAGIVIAETPADAAVATAQWHSETGAESEWIAAYGRAADLTVAGRPGKDEGSLSETLDAALLQTGRPLWIAPDDGAAVLPETVAIAIKGAPEAARAVTAAMPFLAKAKEVVVLSVEEEGAPQDAAERLKTSLGWHGFPVSMARLPSGSGGAAETLLAAAQQRSALLVMGGYGHSRVREWIFGGVTERVLRSAPIPVLMMH